MKESIKRSAQRWGVDLLLLGGAASITAGVALFSAALGLITGGILAITGALLVVKGGGTDAA